jgi:hypothetical protein
MTDINKINDDSLLEKTATDSVNPEEIILEADKIEEKTDEHEKDMEKSE